MSDEFGARPQVKRQETENKARVWVFVEAGLSFVSNLVQKDSVPCLLFLAA